MEQKPYNQINCILNAVCIFSALLSIGLFLTFTLLLTINPQFIAFNEFSSTGKYPAIFFYVSISLTILYFTTFIASLFGTWATNDIFNKLDKQKLIQALIFSTGLALSGLIQISAGIVTIVYTKTMTLPLREYMADNLRSNYTGGLGVRFLERQYDRYVDWVQINYQCCGVSSYEDYRNGYYYNSYNQYTIVSVVPNSCCIYRDQTSQLAQCKMKSVNIYRKGCYEILMFWMQTFGSIITSLSIVSGFLHVIFAIVATRIILQVNRWKKRKLKSDNKSLVKHKSNSYHNNGRQTAAISNRHDMFDTSTIDETLSYTETKT